jgi:hypothetical protein
VSHFTGHLRVGIEAVVAALDAGDIQQGEEIEMNALADLAGELGRLDSGPPLPPTSAYLRITRIQSGQQTPNLDSRQRFARRGGPAGFLGPGL